MKKVPFITKEQAEEIAKKYPTPFHIYDEKGIRENARRLYDAFSWNKGFKEFFAVKATPNPTILKILKEEGCARCMQERCDMGRRCRQRSDHRQAANRVHHADEPCAEHSIPM